MKELVKGQLDWHETVNENFTEVGTGLENKLNKPPVTEKLTEGYVYREADGTTSLKKGAEGGESQEPVVDVFKYTILIDNGTDGNPAAAEYSDDCYGFTEANGSDLGDWGNTKLVKEYFRPCVIQPSNSVPAYYLQKDNRTLKEDGTPAVLTGADGDVMIEVKKLYGNFLSSGDKLKISISNVKEDDSWFCFNDIAGVEKDVVYRGVYNAGVLGSAAEVMRSVSGVAPLVSQTRNTMRGYARNRGTGYHQNNFYMLLLWQTMYLMMYRNRNSQVVLGRGRTLSSNTAAAVTGWSNTKPFCWGDQGGQNGVVFLGVEDFYGNVLEWVDGCCLVNGQYRLTRDPAKYNDTANGYEIAMPSGMTSNVNDKYITKVQGYKQTGFLPAAASGGSSNTYWCDSMWYNDGACAVAFGGDWATEAKAGAFCWALSATASDLYDWVGSRLCRA